MYAYSWKVSVKGYGV